MSKIITDAQIFDVGALLALQDDDEAFARDIIGIFLADLPRRLALLEAAFASKNVAAVGAAAHSLRGGLLGIAAPRAIAAALALEQAANPQVDHSASQEQTLLDISLITLDNMLLSEIELLQQTLASWLANPLVH